MARWRSCGRGLARRWSANQPHREVMEVLPVAVGGLTDADTVAPPEHSPDLRHHPFR